MRPVRVFDGVWLEDEQVVEAAIIVAYQNALIRIFSLNESSDGTIYRECKTSTCNRHAR